MANNTCSGVVISGSATVGNDPVPLFEAGASTMACVLQIEALGQIQVSKAIMDNRIEKTGDATFGGLTLKDAVTKYTLQAQSGQAYYVSTLVTMGRKG
jgi:hypothetical protein